MRNARQRLDDIRNAVRRIEERMPESIVAFQADEMLQVWMVYHLQMIGEAARLELSPVGAIDNSPAL